MTITPARKRGLIVSGTMHAILLLLIIVGLPSLLFDTEIEEPTAITVDILPIAALSNVKPSKQSPVKPKEEEKPPEKPTEDKSEDPLEELKEEKKKASPVVKTKDDKPAPPEVTEAPDAPKIKEKEKPKDEKKEEQKEDPLDAILKGVKDTAAQEKKPSKSSEKKTESSSSANRSNRFDPNSPEAVSVRDAIQSQVYRCWNVPAGAKNADELIIPLEIDYDAGGNPLKVEVATKAQPRYATDPFFRAAADSAIRAVRRCAPLQNLPVESFSIWQYVDMNFNPRDMLY